MARQLNLSQLIIILFIKGNSPLANMRLNIHTLEDFQFPKWTSHKVRILLAKASFFALLIVCPYLLRPKEHHTFLTSAGELPSWMKQSKSSQTLWCYRLREGWGEGIVFSRIIIYWPIIPRLVGVKKLLTEEVDGTLAGPRLLLHIISFLR